MDYYSIKLILHRVLSHCWDFCYDVKTRYPMEGRTSGFTEWLQEVKQVTLIFLNLNFLFCYLRDYLFKLRVVLSIKGKKNSSVFIGGIWNKWHWLLLFISENIFELLGPPLKVLLIYSTNEYLLSIIYVPEHTDFNLQSLYPNMLVLIIRKFIFLYFSLYKWKDNALSANAMYSC